HGLVMDDLESGIAQLLGEPRGVGIDVLPAQELRARGKDLDVHRASLKDVGDGVLRSCGGSNSEWGDLRPVTVMAPRQRLRRTMPVTFSLIFEKKASSPWRTDRNHLPSYTRSAYRWESDSLKC